MDKPAMSPEILRSPGAAGEGGFPSRTAPSKVFFVLDSPRRVSDHPITD
jgi:hypothetical protein